MTQQEAVNTQGSGVTPPAEPAPAQSEGNQPTQTPVDDNVGNDFDEAYDEIDESDTPDGSETPHNQEDENEDDAAAAGEQPQAPGAQVDAHSKEGRTQQLNEEIADLKRDLGLAPNSDIRQLVAERNTLRDIAAANTRKGEIELQQELLNTTNPDTGDFYTPDEAGRMARYASNEAENQRVAQETFELQATHNRSVISRETQTALTEFPIFDEKNTETYNEEAADIAGELLMANYITAPVYGPDGKQVVEDGVPQTQIVNIKSSPYQIMKNVAERFSRIQSRAAQQGEATATTNLARQVNGADMPMNGNNATTATPEAGADFDEAWEAYDD